MNHFEVCDWPGTAMGQRSMWVDAAIQAAALPLGKSIRIPLIPGKERTQQVNATAAARRLGLNVTTHVGQDGYLYIGPRANGGSR